AVARFGGAIAFLLLLWRWPRKRLVELLLHDRQLVGDRLVLHADTGVGLRLLQGLAIVGDGLLRLLLIPHPQPVAVVLLQASEVVAFPELLHQVTAYRRCRFVTPSRLQHGDA